MNFMDAAKEMDAGRAVYRKPEPKNIYRLSTGDFIEMNGEDRAWLQIEDVFAEDWEIFEG
jgi:hypothetical protein